MRRRSVRRPAILRSRVSSPRSSADRRRAPRCRSPPDASPPALRRNRLDPCPARSRHVSGGRFWRRNSPWITAKERNLLCSHRNDRVDVRRSPRGDQRGGKCDSGQEHWYADESRNVGRLDAVEQRAQNAHGEHGNEKSDYDAGDNKTAALREDEPQDVATRRAERHAHAELACALGDGIGDDAVESSTRQHESKCGEDGQDIPLQPRTPERARDSFVEGLDLIQRQLWIKGTDRAADRRY